MVGVVAGEVASLHLLVELLGHLLECWRVGHIVVADACELYHFLRNGLVGIDKQILALLLAVGHYFNVRDLNDAVAHKVETSCLKVENYKGSG